MKVTLFSKHDCQLCDALKYELLDLQVEYRFALDELFVEGGPVLRRGRESACSVCGYRTAGRVDGET